MTLMTWIVIWAVVTTAVVVLGYLRLTFGLHEILGVKFSGSEESKFYIEQGKVERKLEKLDILGIALTALSAVMAVILVLLWAAQSGAAR